MGVQLRVTRPRRAMHERRRQESLGVDLAHSRLALAAERGVVLQIAERRGHGGVVRVADLHADLAADRRPQRRHRLRRRERQIPPRHPIRAVPHPIRLAEGLPRPRMDARRTGAPAPRRRPPHSGRLRPSPGPTHRPGRFASAGVVVVQPHARPCPCSKTRSHGVTFPRLNIGHHRRGSGPPGRRPELPAPQGANVCAGPRARRSGAPCPGFRVPRARPVRVCSALRVPAFAGCALLGFAGSGACMRAGSSRCMSLPGGRWRTRDGRTPFATASRRPPRRGIDASPTARAHASNSAACAGGTRRAPLLCFATEAATGAES